MYNLSKPDHELYKRTQQSLITQQLKLLKNNFPKKYSLDLTFSKLLAEKKSKKPKIPDRNKNYEESNIESHGSVYRSITETPNSNMINFSEIQENAKLLMKNRALIASQEQIIKLKEPIKIPLMVPLSTYRKSQKYPPPVIQKLTNTGEVYSVHLLSDSCKINDPLVKVYAEINPGESKSLAKPEVLSKVANNIKNQLENRSSSLPPAVDPFHMLTPDIKERIPTPKSKAEYYSFRDIEYDTHLQRSPRTWVKERIHQYSNKVKGNFMPKLSESKKLELILLREKQKKITLVPVHKVKIIDI